MDSPLLKISNFKETPPIEKLQDLPKDDLEETVEEEIEPKVTNSIKDLLKNRSQRILNNQRINLKSQQKMRVKRRNKDNPELDIQIKDTKEKSKRPVMKNSKKLKAKIDKTLSKYNEPKQHNNVEGIELITESDRMEEK